MIKSYKIKVLKSYDFYSALGVRDRNILSRLFAVVLAIGASMSAFELVAADYFGPSTGERSRQFILEWQEDNRVTAGQVSVDALNTQILAMDPESPVSFLQRIQLSSIALLKSLRSESTRTRPMNSYSFTARTFCPLLKMARLTKTQTPFLGDDRVIAEKLMLGRNGCGSGLLNGVRIEKENNSYTVKLELSKSLDVKGKRGRYSVKAGKLNFLVVENGEYQTVIGLIGRIYKSAGLHNALKKMVKRYPIGFDLFAAMNAVMDAVNNEADKNQPIRVLDNYTTYVSLPLYRGDGLTHKPSRNSFRWGAFGGEFVMHAPALASRKQDTGYRKSIFSVRPYYEKNQSRFEMAVGEALLIPEVKVSEKWQKVVNGALSSISQSIESHFDSLKKTGIGNMYGPKSSFAKMNADEKRNYILRNKKLGTTPVEPVETSCVGFVLKQLKNGYESNGMGNRWAEIAQSVYDNSGQGTYLLQGLREDGWKLIYWNPDKRFPTTRVVSPSIANDHHIWTWAMIRDGNPYMENVLSYEKVFPGLPIDHMALDFRPSNSSETDFNRNALEILRNIPFFVGVANGGYHVYLGSKGMVIESHSTRSPTDATNIELRPLNQFGLDKGESYLSGVIAVPPGPWMKNLTELVIE